MRLAIDKLEAELALLNPSEAGPHDESPSLEFEMELEQNMPWITKATTNLVESSLVDSNLGKGENYITDQVFYFRYPQRRGQKLVKTEPQYVKLSREWLDIRDKLVRPKLQSRWKISRLDAAREATGENVGKSLLKPGRIARKQWNLRSRPDPSDSAVVNPPLQQNESVFIDRELKRAGDAQGWYYVYTSTGRYGWLRSDGVATDPPEPSADIHVVDEGKDNFLINIAGLYYKSEDGFAWGEDARYYVMAIAYANNLVKRTSPFINLPQTDAEWKQRDRWKSVGVKAGTAIWIPSKEFMQALRGKISSGSITYELWQSAKRAANKIIGWIKYAAGFIAGIVQGALESVYDLLTGVVDLVKGVWAIIKSLISGNLLSDAKKIWEVIKGLDLKAMGAEFIGKWDNENPWDRGLFRGRLAGYVIVEVLLAAFSMGSLTAVKWSGKFAKLMRVLSKVAELEGYAMKMAGKLASLPFPEKAKDWIRKIFRGDPDHHHSDDPDLPENKNKNTRPSVARLELGKADLQRTRKKYNIPDGLHTVAVGKTDVPGLENLMFEGGSRDVRSKAGTNIPRPTQHIEVDQRHSIYRMQRLQDHAEQDIFNHFIDSVQQKKIPKRDLEGKTLAIHISNPKGVCGTCLADGGTFKQFKELFPGMTVRVTWDKPDGKIGSLVTLRGE